MLKVLLFAVTILSTFGHAAIAKQIQVPAGKDRLQAIFDSGSVQSGDTLVLGAGNHGVLNLKGHAFKKPVSLVSASAGRAVFETLKIDRSSGISIKGVTVAPAKTLPKWTAAVTVKNSSYIVLDQLSVSTAANTNGWSASAWRAKVRNGIRVSGSHITILNSALKNVAHGITSDADHLRVENTVVELFSGDGIRGLGDNSTYRGNTVKTCVKVDDNHDDGFQAWSIGPSKKVGKGAIKNVIIDRNTFINDDHRLTCKMQGIGLFDGFYENWTITNNVVIVDHWHGITVLGGKNVKIEGNTVVDSRAGRPGPPWIKIGPHKDGRNSSRSLIKSNVTHSTKPKAPVPVTGVRRSGNKVAGSAKQALDLLNR